MGLFSSIKKVGKNVFGGVKKVISKVAKGVKKSINTVKKITNKTFKGVKELTRNKYVRLGLMITAAVMLPGAIAALPALGGLGVTAAAAATGAISGAVLGAGGVVLAGGSLRDALKAGAFGAATGAAFSAIGSKIKQAQAAAQGGESLAVDAPAVDAPTVDIEATMPDPLDLGDPTSGLNENIAKLASDTPVGSLTDMSPVTNPDTVFVDEVGSAFVKSTEGFKPVSSLNNYTVPEVNVDTSIVGESFDLTQGKLAAASEGLVDVAPTNVPSFGESVANKIKDSFSADKVVDGVFDFGTGMASAAGERFIADKLTDDPIQSGIPAQAQQFGAGMASQAIQFPVIAAEIDPLAAYQNLTYGSGDMNALGGELLRQPILAI